MSENRDVHADKENAVDETVQATEEVEVEGQEVEGTDAPQDEATQRIYELETALSEAQATINKTAYFALELMPTMLVVVLKVKLRKHANSH